MQMLACSCWTTGRELSRTRAQVISPGPAGQALVLDTQIPAEQHLTILLQEFPISQQKLRFVLSVTGRGFAAKETGLFPFSSQLEFHDQL